MWFLIVFVFSIIFIFLGFIKIYSKLTTEWCTSQVCLVGKTTIITGANTGIGFETALDFAKRGARVILACRDVEKAEEARLKIIKTTGNQNILVWALDLASFSSVRKFAKNIIETEDRLDILVNNAGALGLGDQKSIDGLDMTLQSYLVDLLKKSTPSRIVNVSSIVAKRKDLDLKNINKFVSNFYNYSLSKLCNILFTIELSKKLEGTGITTYALHPGVVHTEIVRGQQGYMKILVDMFFDNFSKTSREGAQTTIYCAVSQEIKNYSGYLFQDCKKIRLFERANNENDAKKLWQLSEKIIEYKFE